MAQFLRIGDFYINVALIARVRMADDEVSISLIAPGGLENHSFKGEGVVSAFREWLEQNTHDLGVTPDPTPHS